MTSDAVSEIQAQTMAALSPLFARGTSVAMLDFPMHKNAGDSFIYLGQRSYLRRLDVQVGYIADIYRLDPGLLRARTDGPILLQGGGNLGDVWPDIQLFREHVIQTFPDRPIVQMPQSVHFASTANARRARAVFEEHPDLLLLLRDERALASARELFPATRSAYCPDMAFGMGWIRRSRHRPPSVDVLRLLRSDRENPVGQRADLPAGVTSRTVDWNLPRPVDSVWRGLRLPGQLARHAPLLAGPSYPLVHLSYDRIARLHLWQAVRTLGAGTMVVSNRLHAVVLAGLMGLPFVALDNIYGKVSAVFDDYLGTLPGAHQAADEQELSAAVRCHVPVR